MFDEEMTVPINNGEPISNDEQSIYPIANAKLELSIKRHSDAGDVSPPNSANFVSSYLMFPSSVQKTDEVMNSAGVFAGHVAMGIMAGATDMFKTALASSMGLGRLGQGGARAPPWIFSVTVLMHQLYHTLKKM